MNTRLSALVTVALAASAATAQTPLGTGFTYQGQLKEGGSPVVGLHDLRFALYDASAGGAQVGATLCADDVSVADGLFTVSLDFGAQFAGQERFLEVQVRADTGLDCGNLAGFVFLAPRQALTAAPYALFALSASTATTATTAANATQLNGQAAAFYQNASNLSSGTLADARLSSNVARLNNAQTFTGAKTFSLAPSFTAAGAPFSVSGTSLVTNLNADLIDGLDSSAFLQSVPVPLTLIGSTVSSIIRGENTSNGTGSSGVLGRSTLAGGNLTRGVVGESNSVNGTGVFGWATADSGITYGVHGESDSPNGRGVVGSATANTGTNYGVYGWSDGTSGRGVVGAANAVTGATFGGRFESDSTDGRGVLGLATAATGTVYGVEGISDSTSGRGVFGWATNTAMSSTIYGVYGLASTIPGGYAVFASGDLGASGLKPFRIDHPFDPENKYLLHYATESPSPQNFYSGNVLTDGAGYAWVELPDYFEEINTDYKYQLTVIDDADADAFVLAKVSKEIRENRFQVRTSAPREGVLARGREPQRSLRSDQTAEGRRGKRRP